MRNSIISAKSAAFIIAFALVSTSAAATDIHQAVKLCDANPNCTYRDSQVAGHLVMDVKTSEGDKVVECKRTGPCVVSFQVPGGGKSVGNQRGKSAGNVAVVLAKSPGGAVKSPKGGLLEPGHGMPSGGGPASTGAPAAPAAPAAGRIR